ncbi:hypothetical protein BCR37DRAFT_375998 [Protomyces lactucae-debilis]|uniref:Uncharacterized protein n=1 Tax=Protomyces lactucae-debilis TaxID=2754530 RepID=A0A1Y2FVH8_PROLT|nr:uncharacterized protein BCR37DRAFT_375998 [Protomyces lactucae-debilis]ORY88010.1 hypothetical protein BCR37DRAFT_375998 [Protomyces lactucae-debilis]
MVDRSFWETLTFGRRLIRLKTAQNGGETGLEAEIADIERERDDRARTKNAERMRKRRAEAFAEESELEERARQTQLPSSDDRRFEGHKCRRIQEAARQRLRWSSQSSRRSQTPQARQALSNLSSNAVNAGTGSSASYVTAPNALPSQSTYTSTLDRQAMVNQLGFADMPSSDSLPVLDIFSALRARVEGFQSQIVGPRCRIGLLRHSLNLRINMTTAGPVPGRAH